MKPQIQSLSFALAVAMATCLSIAARPAGAVEVSYSFDFDDGMMPAELTVFKYPFPDPVTATLDYDISDGQLRVYDTVSAACDMEFQNDDVLTDVHLSAVVSPGGGYPRGNCYFCARTEVTSEMDPDVYLFVLKSGSSGIGIRMEMYKRYNGAYVYQEYSPYIFASGPYLMEFDVVDVDEDGEIHTDLTARLTYNDGQSTETLRHSDYSSQTVRSGFSILGAYLSTQQRTSGWKLDMTFDDFTIRGTPLEDDGVLGDLSGDGVVNSTDLDIVRANWGQSVSPQTNGDADGDGVVASGDLDIVRANWGATAAASVPEPTFLALGSLAAALFLARRR